MVAERLCGNTPAVQTGAAGIAGQAAAGADHAVAGNDEGDRIAAYGAADSLGGHPPAAAFGR